MSYEVYGSPPPLWGQGVRGARGNKESKGYVIPGFRVPTTSVRVRGGVRSVGVRLQGQARGMLY